MLSVKNFIILTFLVASSKAATLTCKFSGAACPNFTLSSVLQMNDVITVVSAPSYPYVDSITQSLSIRDYANEPQFPQNIVEFPNRIFSIFNNLTGFYMENAFNTFMGPATELGTDAVYNCARLDRFGIRGGKIGRVAAGFARSCAAMTDLTLQAGISSIDENAFIGLVNLKYIAMNQNALTCIPPKLFQNSKQLISIGLAQNQITAVHSHAFVGLTKLAYLGIGSNKISYIPSFNIGTTGTDASVTQGLGFDFSNNPIQAISPAFLVYLSSISRIVPSTKFLSLNFKPSVTTVTTCVPSTAAFTGGDIYNIGRNAAWSLQNTFYLNSTTCYTAFTPEMGFDRLITCGGCNSADISSQVKNLLVGLNTCYPDVKSLSCA